MINSGPGCSRLSVLLLGAAMGWCRNCMQRNGLAWRSETNDANVWGLCLLECGRARERTPSAGPLEQTCDGVGP